MLASKSKIVPIEVKSSGIGKHESITEFQKKYSKHVAKEILLSQKDIGNREMHISGKFLLGHDNLSRASA